MRGGQSWSIDVVIGVLIFLLVIGVFYAILTSSTRGDTTDLKISSETIAEKLTNDPKHAIIVDESVDREKLKEFALEEYIRLKQQFGVNTEFCVFFKDENGNVVNISDGLDSYVGIGSAKINISGIKCHEVDI